MVSITKDESRKVLRSIVRPGKIVHVEIDVDEVLAKVHEIMITNYNKAKGTHYTINDHKDWDFKSIGSDYTEMMGFYVDAWKNHYDKIKLAANPQVILELGQYFTLDIASSRDYYGTTGGTSESLGAWIDMHKLQWMPHFCDPTKINKLDQDYEVNIDDSPRLAKELMLRKSGFLLLVDRPYNRDLEQSTRILRVDGFDGAAKELIRAARAVHRKKMLYQSDDGQRFIHDPQRFLMERRI